jgi:hypothetical protein
VLSGRPDGRFPVLSGKVWSGLTRLAEVAVREVGMFGNQNTVCKPTTPKWRSTVERLKQHFSKAVP